MSHDDENRRIVPLGYNPPQGSVPNQGTTVSDPGASLNPGLDAGTGSSSESPSESSSASNGKWDGFSVNTLSAVIGAVIASVVFLFLSNTFTAPGQVEMLDKAVTHIEEITLPKLETDLETQISTIQDNLEKEISTVQGDLEKNISEAKNDIDTVNDNIEDFRREMNSLTSLFIMSLQLKPTPNYAKQMIAGLGRRESFDMNTGPVFMKAVVYSSFGVEYTADQFAEMKLLLPYDDGDAEGFFYGSFSENNRWDGNCIVNLYKEGKLVLITDAVYDDGNILSCKQVFPDVTTKETLDDGTVLQYDIWVISDRVIENGVSSGETWHYFRDGDFQRKFDADKITPGDIISVDEFRDGLTGGIEGYYSGNVSNGFFNDDTGRACMVKFFPSGLVKTLYIGKVKDGQFYDTSGNAWMKGKKRELQPTYSYYVGSFVNGTTKDGKWEDKDDKANIEKMIASLDLPVELLWEFPRV